MSKSTRAAAWITVVCCVAAFGVYCVRRQMDFTVYYDAALRAAGGELDLFQLQVADPGLAYRYAPVLAWLLTPLTWVPLPVAAYVWYLLKILALVQTVRIAMRLTASELSAVRVGIAAFLLAGAYIVEELMTGNMHALGMFAVVLALDGVSRGRVALPSLALALAILAKVTPVIALPFLVVRKEWRVFAGTIVALVALSLAPSLVVGHRTNAAWLNDWKQTALARIEAGPNEHDASVKGALLRFLSATDVPPENFPSVRILAVPRQIVVASAYAVSALFVGLLLLTARSVAYVPQVGLLMVTILLVSPHSTRIYYCGLFFPYLLLVIAGWRDDSRAGRSLRVALWVSLVLNSVIAVVVPGRAASLAYQAAAPFVFTAVIAWILLYRLARREVDGNADHRELVQSPA